MIKTINKKDILYTSIFHYIYFDRVNGSTYRIIKADIHMKGGYLIRAYSPLGYGYGSALDEMVNDLSKQNGLITCREVRELLKPTLPVEKNCKLKECREIDHILKVDGIPLTSIKITN